MHACMQPLFTQIQEVCGDFSPETAECSALISQMDSYLGNFYIYNIVCRYLDWLSYSFALITNLLQYDTCGGDQVVPRGEMFERLRANVTLNTTADAFWYPIVPGYRFYDKTVLILGPTRNCTQHSMEA
jgi:hypothetical protein